MDSLLAQDKVLPRLIAEALQGRADELVSGDLGVLRKVIGETAQSLLGLAPTDGDVDLLLEKIRPRLEMAAKKGRHSSSKSPRAPRKPRPDGKATRPPPDRDLPAPDAAFDKILGSRKWGEWADGFFEKLKTMLAPLDAADEERLRTTVVLHAVLMQKAFALARQTTEKQATEALSKEVGDLMAKVNVSDKALGITRDQREKARLQGGESAVQLIEQKKKKAMAYIKKHPEILCHWACAACGQIHMTNIPHPFFEGAVLWNHPLAMLVEQGILTSDQAARVLGWSAVSEKSSLTAKGFVDIMRKRGHQIVLETTEEQQDVVPTGVTEGEDIQ